MNAIRSWWHLIYTSDPCSFWRELAGAVAIVALFWVALWLV